MTTGPEPSSTADFLFPQNRSLVRLRTLILLRWIAIVGQIAALTVAQRYYNLQLEIGLCYLTVGVSVIGNLFAIFIFPENKRLSEAQNFLMVLFDMVQLGVLLYLTGGLHNPFALLLLGPVTISASALKLRSFIIMAVTAIAIASLLSQFYYPLRTYHGFILRLPYPFMFGSWLSLVIAIVFIGAYSRRVSNEMTTMTEALAATQLALAREQKLTDLGGVVAAAAHELGTPLATIKLTSSELVEELDDAPELAADAQLIREQADRCRDILRDMGRAGKDDTHLRTAPLSTVVQEAAEPHEGRGIAINYDFLSNDLSDPSQPIIQRKPEIIHGLRNLVQNGVDFAQSAVWVDAEWSENTITIRIGDDGPGYPSNIIGRIGDPFMKRSKKSQKARPGYEGMGLGLFIAKTLLERSGASLTFMNRSDDGHKQTKSTGAIVTVTWDRSLVTANSRARPLEENQRFRAG